MIWLMFFADILVEGILMICQLLQEMFFFPEDLGERWFEFDEYPQVLQYPFRLGDAIVVNVWNLLVSPWD